MDRYQNIKIDIETVKWIIEETGANHVEFSTINMI